MAPQYSDVDQLTLARNSFNIREKLEDDFLRRSLQAFREPIDFSLEAAVPVPKPFAETISNRIETHKSLIEESEMHIIQRVFELVTKKKSAKKANAEGKGKEKGELTKEDKKREKRRRRRRLMNNSSGHFFDAEKVQEQEQEREQQQEQEVCSLG